MKKFILAMVGAAAMAAASVTASAYDMTSLRGHALDSADKSFEAKKQITVQGGFTRSWETAPPAIPHTIDKDEVSIKNNTCLRCHSEANYKKEKSPKIGDSHFLDEKGQKQATMSMRRYFCGQCHVPQVEATPLVENTFVNQPYTKK